MSAEYVDNTPIGEGGAPIVTLDIPEGTDELESSPEQPDNQGEPTETPVAEAAAAEDKEEAKEENVEAKTPEEKPSYWRGEHFKLKEATGAQLAELEGKLLEANANPGFIKLDVPPDQWDPKQQLEGMPAAYADKLRSHGFWETLPNVIENLDSQPIGVQNALYETMNKVFQKRTGVSFEEMTNRLEGAAPQAQAQPQADLIQSLLEQGYTEEDAPVKAARWAAAQEGRLKQLEAAGLASTKQQQAFAEQQQAESKRQAEAAFESKKTGVWDNALKTFEGKVPTGKEFMLDYIRDRAEKLVTSDSIAKGYLDKVQGFLRSATNPQEREQYEKLASGSLAAYSAKVAIAIQKSAKELLGEIAEKEQLRSTVAANQMMRRDITPGGPGAPSGSREEILKGKIGDNSDVAAEMGAALYRARHRS